MPMNVLQQAADKLGYLIYAMDQSNTAPLTQPGPWGAVQGGYCAGLATRWIALRYAAHDYPFDKATKLCDFPDWQSTRDQNVVIAGYDDRTRRFPAQFKEAYAQYGLQLNLGAVTRAQTAMSGQILRRAGLAAEGCHCIYIAGKGGAHAVAMMNQGSLGWRFFDANFGHFKLPDAKAFEVFIDWYMRHSGYTRNDFLSEYTATVHISPPPFTGASFASVMKILTNRLDR